MFNGRIGMGELILLLICVVALRAAYEIIRFLRKKSKQKSDQTHF